MTFATKEKKKRKQQEAPNREPTNQLSQRIQPAIVKTSRPARLA